MREVVSLTKVARSNWDASHLRYRWDTLVSAATGTQFQVRPRLQNARSPQSTWLSCVLFSSISRPTTVKKSGPLTPKCEESSVVIAEFRASVGQSASIASMCV